MFVKTSLVRYYGPITALKGKMENIGIRGKSKNMTFKFYLNLVAMRRLNLTSELLNSHAV